MNHTLGFADGFNFTATESERLFAFAALDAKQMQGEVDEVYALEDLRPFDTLPFARHPLIIFQDRVYCVSLALLRDLAGMNIQHRFLDPRVFDEKERERFL